jgi:hypothetical protein
MNTPKSYNTRNDRATLTESELFQRFLDAPIRIGSGSTLIKSFGPSELTAHDLFYYHCISFCDSVCFDDELPTHVIEVLRGCDDPLMEIDNAIAELEALISGIQMLKREFEPVIKATRTESPEEDASDEEYSEWYENPCYVLPVIEQEVAA